MKSDNLCPQSEIELFPVFSEEDTEEVSALAKEIWHEHYDPIIGKEQVDYMTEKFQSKEAMMEQMEKEGYRYYRLVSKDGPAGYIAYRTDSEGLFLSKIYIGKKYRGRGYSRRVMVFLEQCCKEQTLHRIWLTVNRNNTASIAAYDKLGFSKIRTLVTDIGSGFVMDDYIMEKVIGP